MKAVDDKPYYRKYNVTRLDGKPVERTIVIEIDKDPQAPDVLSALAHVYSKTRPTFSDSLVELMTEITNTRPEAASSTPTTTDTPWDLGTMVDEPPIVQETKELRFYGRSDDCFYVKGPDIHEEIYGKAYQVSSGDQKLLVTGRYAELLGSQGGGFGAWEIGVTQAFEEDEAWSCPAWPARFEKEHDYSVCLVLTVPVDAVVETFQEYGERGEMRWEVMKSEDRNYNLSEAPADTRLELSAADLDEPNEDGSIETRDLWSG